MQAQSRTGLQDSGTTADLAQHLGDSIESATIGTDKDGYDHHYWLGADCIVVYDDDDVDHVEHLNGRVLTDWVNYVDEERGWLTMGPFAGALIDADRRRKEDN